MARECICFRITSYNVCYTKLLRQVYEFYGMALDRHGDVVLENANMTLAGNTLIQPPEEVRYSKLRWPGISFSPMPDLLSTGGRGLLHGA